MMEMSPAESPANSHLPPKLPRPPQRKKKTRELPNLSNCHCCNRRVVNCNTNPKNRLKTLNSEWRIVLLCDSCYCLVESSQICSYCLTNFPSSSADSTFECKSCRRRIHRKCVSMFGSGSGNGGEFFVCFDCWVPKLLENDYIRVCKTRPRKKDKKEVKVCGDSTSLESSRVSDSQDKGKCLEKMVNVANVVAQKKVIVALEAQENAVAKAMSARRAVEHAGNAMNFASVDSGGGGGNRGGLVVDDDAQLAFQLHRAMNSSRRISRNSCLLNANCVNTISVNANAQDFHSQEAEKTSKVVNVGSEANTTDTNTLSYREQSGLCSAETKQGFVRKTDEAEGKKSKLASNSNDCLITYSRKRQTSQDGRSKQTNGLLRMYRRRLSDVESRNAERDLSLKTYRRRLWTTSRCTNKLMHGGYNLEPGSLAPTPASNCCKEPRLYADAS